MKQLLNRLNDACFQIRNADMSWKEAKRVLRKDSRSEATEILQKEEKEKMFAEHIDKLTMKKRIKFRLVASHKDGPKSLLFT